LWLLAGLAPAVGLFLWGCVYQPSIPDGAIRCDDSQRCPRGLICNAVRDGATVLLVCCRNPGCAGSVPVGPGGAASPPPPGNAGTSPAPPPMSPGNPGTLVGPITPADGGSADARPSDATPGDGPTREAGTITADGSADASDGASD
jgi:hypothetical protein